jgi:hypothetical protein
MIALEPKTDRSPSAANSVGGNVNSSALTPRFYDNELERYSARLGRKPAMKSPSPFQLLAFALGDRILSMMHRVEPLFCGANVASISDNPA